MQFSCGSDDTQLLDILDIIRTYKQNPDQYSAEWLQNNIRENLYFNNNKQKATQNNQDTHKINSKLSVFLANSVDFVENMLEFDFNQSKNSSSSGGADYADCAEDKDGSNIDGRSTRAQNTSSIVGSSNNSSKAYPVPALFSGKSRNWLCLDNSGSSVTSSSSPSHALLLQDRQILLVKHSVLVSNLVAVAYSQCISGRNKFTPLEKLSNKVCTLLFEIIINE